MNIEREKADKNKLMEELWKLASEFIGDDLLNTKAYLMYHGKREGEREREMRGRGKVARESYEEREVDAL